MELRTELDRVSSLYHEIRQKLEDSISKNARIDQLEVEVQMYKDAAKQTSVESQSIAISASEAVERSVKTTQDKHNLLRSLQNAESELGSCKNDNQRVKAELSEERQKHKVTYLEKLSAERKASELLTAKSKSDAAMDEVSSMDYPNTFNVHISNQTHDCVNILVVTVVFT